MLNQISKLKGNEIFSLVTPEGLDLYIITRDLIGNVLNVVEDILRKREQPPQVVPISEDCEDAKRLAEDACNKATIAHLNSKDALEKTKNVLDALNEVRYKSTTALSKAANAEIVSKSVLFLSHDLNTLKSLVNNMVGDVNNLNTNMVTIPYLNEIVGELNNSRLADLSRLNQSINNLATTQYLQASELSTLASGLEGVKTILRGLEGISPEDIVTLKNYVTQLSNKEAEDISNVNSEIGLLETSIGTSIRNLETSITQVEESSKVNLTHSNNTYTLSLGNGAIGEIVVPEQTTIDSELSLESTNPIQNKVINRVISNINSDLFDLGEKLSETLDFYDGKLDELNLQIIELKGLINDLSNSIYYSVTDSYTNQTTRVKRGDSYTVILPGENYDLEYLRILENLIVTMGGISIPLTISQIPQHQELNDFLILIPEVTGDVIISYTYELRAL